MKGPDACKCVADGQYHKMEKLRTHDSLYCISQNKIPTILCFCFCFPLIYLESLISFPDFPGFFPFLFASYYCVCFCCYVSGFQRWTCIVGVTIHACFLHAAVFVWLRFFWIFMGPVKGTPLRRRSYSCDVQCGPRKTNKQRISRDKNVCVTGAVTPRVRFHIG